MLPIVPDPDSVYVHVPFCRHRCGYCNFALVADRDYLIEGYLKALRQEMDLLQAGGRVSTVFLGGGTPTLLSNTQIRTLFSMISERFAFAEEIEFTIEANPNDITSEKVELLAELGINRISLGAQSFDLNKLKLLERDHSPQQIIDAINFCRKRFNNISIDLIFGVQAETKTTWQRDLEQAISATVQHLSTYELTIEKGTQFWIRNSKNESMKVGEELNAQLYQNTIQTMTERGFEHYEVSSFARPGYRCRHNQAYWNGNRYFAFGPGAASFVGRTRSVNHTSVAEYCRKLNNNSLPVVQLDELSDRQIAIDMLTFGIRQSDGCDLDRVKSFTGFTLDQLSIAVFNEFQQQELLMVDEFTVKLTDRGRMFADLICQRIFNCP